MSWQEALRLRAQGLRHSRVKPLENMVSDYGFRSRNRSLTPLFIDDDGEVPEWFGGFRTMQGEIERQAFAVNSSPPARLRWYFQTPKTLALMFSVLNEYRVESEWHP